MRDKRRDVVVVAAAVFDIAVVGFIFLLKRNST